MVKKVNKQQLKKKIESACSCSKSKEKILQEKQVEHITFIFA